MALLKSPAEIRLGVNKTHYASHGDVLGRCPSCCQQNVVKVGVLTINGTPQDVRKCNNCNALSASADGGIASLIEEAKEQAGPEGHIGFTSVVDGTNVTANISSGPMETKLDYQSQQTFQNLNGQISTLTYALQDLVRVVEDLAHKNNQLVEKLATDPLVTIRKQISAFNLE